MNRRKSIKALIIGIFGGLFTGKTLNASSRESFDVKKSTDETSILKYINKHGEAFELLENEYGDLCVYRDEEQILRFHSRKHIDNIPDTEKSEFDQQLYISYDDGTATRIRSLPNLTIDKFPNPWNRVLNK